jgi:hypothetical protein
MCYNGVYRGWQERKLERILKNGLSTDYSLKLRYMKPELLVIANHYVAVNGDPGFVHTARHAMRVGRIQSCTRRFFFNNIGNTLFCKRIV